MKGRIECGAQWLDDEHPGWLDRVNLDKLCMTRSDRCILGQGAGPDLYDALYEDKGERWLVEHGFDISTDKYTSRQEVQAHARLGEDWITYIKQRRTDK